MKKSTSANNADNGRFLKIICTHLECKSQSRLWLKLRYFMINIIMNEVRVAITSMCFSAND